MHLVLLATLLFAQPEVKHVGRTEKEPYIAGVRELGKAVELIADDPQSAIEKVSTILSSSKIKYFECRLNIEVAPQIFEKHDFFPYQVRGRARLAQAKKAVGKSPENAIALIQSAIEDFKASAAKKVPGNEDLLKQADKDLEFANSKIVREKPADVFRQTVFLPLIRSNKFKSAASAATGDDGKPLTEEERKGFVADAEEACKIFISDRLIIIRRYLGDITTVRALKDLAESGYRQQFANQVPSDAELTEKAAQDPAFVWIRKHHKTLRAIQVGQAKLEEVFAAALEGLSTEAPDAEGDNPWFRAMALLGCNLVDEIIFKCTDKSEYLPKIDRDKRQAEAEKAHAAWKEFVGKTDKKVQERHPELGERSVRLEQSVKEFPVELTDLSKFDVDSCFTKDPATDFKKVEDGLSDLVRAVAGMGRVAIESRQELYTKYIIAGTYRRIIDGMGEDDIIKDFGQHVKDGLKKAGGPGNLEKYGPKVKKVFDALKT